MDDPGWHGRLLPADSAARDITRLRSLAAALAPASRARFDRLLLVSESEGRLVAPPKMHAWIRSLFGSVEAVQAQRIVKTTNRVTYEGTLFNALRASRPIETELPAELESIVTAGMGDPFCIPLEGTPADEFGRIHNDYGITASNIAKSDAYHAVIVSTEHSPLRIGREEISGHIDLGLQWGARVMTRDPAACYWFMMWNCMWKGGASILHGHTQVLATRDLHYAKVEHLRAAAQLYRERTGEDYFEDLLGAHADLGLTVGYGSTRIMASLTPVKEKELWLVDDGLGPDLREAVYRVLHALTTRLGVVSFNLVVYRPPAVATPEDWTGFPTIVRIVDRGPLTNKTADVGALELYGSSVVSADPFKLIGALAPAFE
ncbi:MAG: hypothetical protein IT307_06870 [Chloroflexi bacterium]|nr:hypothetical protein [Chloroflexota bacterium]